MLTNAGITECNTRRQNELSLIGPMSRLNDYHLRMTLGSDILCWLKRAQLAEFLQLCVEENPLLYRCS